MVTPPTQREAQTTEGTGDAWIGLRIFVSYAGHDRRMAERMVVHLRPLVRWLAADIWFDREPRAGQDWSHEISEAIGRSDVFVLLLSPDYLASDYAIDHELPRIQERARQSNALVLPLIMKPCLWQFSAGSAQAIPTDDGHRIRPVSHWRPAEEGYHVAAEQILKAIERHFAVSPHNDMFGGTGRYLTDEQINHAVDAAMDRRRARA